MASRRSAGSGSSSLKTGGRVEYSVQVGSSKRRIAGVIAYGPGPFHLKPGENDWCGVVLEEPLGKNNGTVQGKAYFTCADNYGVMVKAGTLRAAPAEGSSRIPGAPGSRSSTPTSTPSMTPSSSIASFTGMFDSKDGKMSDSATSQTMSTSATTAAAAAPVSRLKPPTKVTSGLSGSTSDISATTTTTTTATSATSSSHIPKPSGIPSVKDNIRAMVEKIETKCDEKAREESDAQDISHKLPSSASFDSAAARENAELKETIKDLESKLATIMAIRAADKLKFKELERLKIQSEQLQENKRQMAERVAELSKAKAAAERAAEEAREEATRQAEEIKDLIDNAEMAVIDKEMAENRAEALQLELETLKEALEEKSIDYELLRSEIEDKGAEGAAGSFQVKQLEEQNARYKEALLKFRDLTSTDRSNMALLQKELEAKAEEVAALQALKERNGKEIARYVETVQELTEQVDMALGSQEMVEKLTEKNLELEDRAEELQKALDEEEGIKELSNMILEEKDDIIADLREELDRCRTQLVNLRNSYVAAQEAVSDHEGTIKKFRSVVAALREENHLLRASQEQDLSRVAQAVDVQAQLENIEFKTRLLDRKDLGRAIDMELRQLDVDQCYRYAAYLGRFFPESFFARGADHDAIAVLLFVPRIFTKCSIIERQVLEKFNSSTGSGGGGDGSAPAVPQSSDSVVREVFQGSPTESSSPPGKQLQLESLDKLKGHIFTKHILYLLTSIRSLLDKYQEVLGRCDAELFMKLGSLFPELSAHEKSVDHYVDLLRADKLDETVTLDSLEKTLSYLQSLYNIYMAPSSSTAVEGSSVVVTTTTTITESHNKFLHDLLEVFRTGTEAALLDVKVLGQLTAADSARFIGALETALSDVEQFARKIRRRMVSAGAGAGAGATAADLANPACVVRFPGAVEAELFDASHHLTLTVRCLKLMRSTVLLQYINEVMQGGRGGGDSSQAKPLSSTALCSVDELDKTCKDLTGNSLKSLAEMMANVMGVVSKLSTSLQQGDYDVAKQPSGGSGSGGGNEASLGDHGSGGFSSLTSATSTAGVNQTSSLFFNSLQSVQSLFGSSGSSSSSSGGNNRQQPSAQPLTSLPLDERAQRWRAQSDQMGECRAKLATQEADIAELRRVLKSKLDEVSEMQIRRDLAEKRLALAVKESSGRQAEIDRLRAEMAEKEAELERTANRFNTEMREMVEFNQNMQEKFKDIKQSALMGKMMLASPGVVVASSPGAGGGGGGAGGTGTGSPSGPGSLSGQQGNTSLLGMSFQTAVSSPGGFSSSGASVHTSSLGSTAVGGGGGGSAATMMVSGDVAELHQTVVDLRQAMKRMARRNYDLRVLLSSSNSSSSSSSTSSSTDLKMSSTEGQLKPFWYVESLRRSRQRQQQQQQQQYTSLEDGTTTAAEDCFPKFGDRKELQLAEMRHKLLDFKYEVMRARCSGGALSSLPSSEALVAAGQLKPGWTRSLGELLKRGAQEEALARLEYSRRYRQLKGAVEDLVKKGLEEGYACEADYATFLAPHISKVIDSKPQLVARITMPDSKNCNKAAKTGNTSVVVPVEVTMAQLRQITASLVC